MFAQAINKRPARNGGAFFKIKMYNYSIMEYQKTLLNIANWNISIQSYMITEKKINQLISHQLVKAREELGLKQMKVQNDKIMRQSTLSKIENGAKNISAAKLFLLATYYKKPIEYFFDKSFLIN